ncbi:ribosome recycling factor [Candidatus Saccharibacteria bacterium]|nr:ribosome recycling factor [Candidatus Saccharibacteria bacterium]
MMFDTKEDCKKMEDIIERFKSEMKKVRTGRAHPDMLSGIKVEVYGQFMPLNQAANITAADATLLVVTPFDPANIAAIEAAIRADQALGLNPADDGRVIRVPIPPLTEERRKEIVKNASEKVENAKVALRNVREDARKAVKITKELSEDVKKRAEKDIEDLTKEFTDKIDTEFKNKSDEIMKI